MRFFTSAVAAAGFEVAFNYGGGVKVHISPRFGLRFDVRGLILPHNPTFRLPNFHTGGELHLPEKM